MKIYEVELAFANACTADCYICSKKRGCNNDVFMSPDVFNKAVSELKKIDFEIMQTGGNGDSFLHLNFLDCLRVIRKEFPRVKVSLYSNFFLLFPHVADILIGENLIDLLSTRIDSVIADIFTAATGLDTSVFDNIDYFLSKNKKINFSINYSNIQRYRDNCRKILNKEPYYWNEVLDTAPDDEFENVKSRFWNGKVKFNDIKRTFWAERNDPNIKPNPSAQCDRNYCFQNVLYIWPNGDVGVCGYDDEQSELIVGSVMNQNIEEIWNSQRRKNTIDDILNRRITGYPCIDPTMCKFW